MSTNYYHRTNICGSCHRYDEIHIGKLSGGWQFSFRAHDEIRSWKDWQAKIIQGGQIFDEYGEAVPLAEFGAIVENSRGKEDHIDYLQKSPSPFEREHIGTALHSGDQFHDPDGFSFSFSEFS